jgi:hypothetical protein
MSDEQQKFDGQKLLTAIRQAEGEGKLIIMTIEGLAVVPIADILNQPAEGLLYDLNRDRVTLASRIAKGDQESIKTINDYALVVIVEKLFAELETLQAQAQPAPPRGEEG